MNYKPLSMLAYILTAAISAAPIAFSSAVGPPITASSPLDLLDALGRGWTCEATSESMGDQVRLVMTNPGQGAELLIDAGTVFKGPYDVQPAVVTEDVLVYVPSGGTQELLISGACGAADAMAASEGVVFDQGVYKLPDELCRILDRIWRELDEPERAAQDLVWVYTDDHGFESVFVQDQDQEVWLDILEEEVQDFEDPGYAVQYREPEPEEGGRFTGEAMEARCNVTVNLPHKMACRVVLLQPDGERIELMSNMDITAGPHEFFLTIGLDGYPSGAYTLQLESERHGNTLFSRELTLESQG